MKRLTYYYKTENTYDFPVTDHQFLLRCMPRMNASQSVLSASVLLSPDVGYTQQQDSFGNVIQIGRIGGLHDHFSYTAIGEVEVDHTQRNQSALHPMYKYPTALTRMSAKMEKLAAQYASMPKTLDTVVLLSGEVHFAIRYTPDVTGVRTGADEAFGLGAGVCQDYAHVLIALLRAESIPARYVCGLSVGEGVTHAWAEAYLDGCWIGIDPTRNILATEEYVTFAVGRDAADCPIDRGIFIGAANHTQTVFMRLMEQ